jgi:type III secretory pathway component EscV
VALALLVVPLPALVLDVAWAMLLGASLLVVLAALGVVPQRGALRQLSSGSFPTVLLLLTLLRLSLSLATLRAVLAQASTPGLVQGLSRMMVGSNPWLAWVLFLSLVIAQLVVVVRGNERIAEVLARFALDALPGRQLSIDAELRSGSLHTNEARRQRQALSQQSELFGTLDGVMKLVRGEQIALLFMVALCVAGGTLLSVLDGHQPIGEAFRHWSGLGIGIGLIAQLSAFAVAIATGVILTRSSSESQPGLQEGVTLATWSLSTRTGLPGATQSHIKASLEEARSNFFADSGIPVPACRITIDTQTPEGHGVLSIRGIPARTLALPPGNDGNLSELVERCLTEHANELLGIAETQTLLDNLDPAGATAAAQVVPRLLNVTALNQVLRRLVAEQVSIRDLKTILEALAGAASTETDPATLTELVRSQLKRTLSHQHVTATGEIHALLLDASLEGVLRGSIVKNKGSTTLSLSPAAARDFVAAVTSHLTRARETHPTVVLLASPDVRRFVRHLLETDFPALPVLSPSELLPQTAVHPLGTITLQSL